MPGMEDDAKRFLQRIVWSLFSGFLWLTLTLGIGIYNDWMVPNGHLRWFNIVFYAWMVISTALLVYVNYRIWREKFPHG